MSHQGAAVDPGLVEPFHLAGRRRPPCLLVHGFTGTPYETRALGEHLHERGHAAVGIRLAGHGASLVDLERADWKDWYASVTTACEQLAAEAGPAVVIGLSAGALLALHLAHERPRDVCGLVLLATAISLGDWRARWLLPAVARVPVLRRRFRFVEKAAGSDIRDEAARRVHPGHRVIPLAAAASLVALQHRVRGELHAITQPTLLVHGKLDRTCPVSSVTMLEQHLGAKPRRTLILRESAHVVTVDRERDKVLAAVADFVAGLS